MNTQNVLDKIMYKGKYKKDSYSKNNIAKKEDYEKFIRAENCEARTARRQELSLHGIEGNFINPWVASNACDIEEKEEIERAKKLASGVKIPKRKLKIYPSVYHMEQGLGKEIEG